jgi:hypothetical protein
MSSIAEVELKIDAHVDNCAIRYEGIAEAMRGVNARLKRLESILITATGSIMLLLVGLVIKTYN